MGVFPCALRSRVQWSEPTASSFSASLLIERFARQPHLWTCELLYDLPSVPLPGRLGVGRHVAAAGGRLPFWEQSGSRIEAVMTLAVCPLSDGDGGGAAPSIRNWKASPGSHSALSPGRESLCWPPEPLSGCGGWGSCYWLQPVKKKGSDLGGGQECLTCALLCSWHRAGFVEGRT